VKRRTFIKKGSLASAGILAVSTSTLGAISYKTNSSVINIGIIGSGNRGVGLIPLINEIEGLNLVAICDVLDFRLKEGLEKSEKKLIPYTNYKDLLNNKDIDAVVVATPFNTHSSIAIDALDTGKHVYCEKTLAKGLDGINNLVNKVYSTNLIFQTGHQYHSSKLYTHVVELINKGEIGQVVSFECQWNRYSNWRREVKDPKHEKAINWRMYKEYSGGPVAELCSHQIDFVNWVLQENPKKIMGAGGNNYWKDGRETFEDINLIFEYPSGVKATFESLSSNESGGYEIKVKGSKATIVIDHHNAWIRYREISKEAPEDLDAVSGATNSYKEAKGIQLAISDTNPTKQALLDFRNSILNNKQPLSNVTTGANTAKAVQLALDALYNQKIAYWSSLS